METVNDVRNALVRAHFEQDDTKKVGEKKRRKFVLKTRVISPYVNKSQRIQKGQAKMENPEKLATQRRKNKQKHKALCVVHHCP